MIKNKRTTFLITSIIILLLFFGGRFVVSEKKPLSWYDVVFTVETDSQSFDIRLWHNYNNDENYLFLPSFLRKTEDIKAVKTAIPAKYRKIWDNEVSFKGDSFAGLNLEEGIHELKIGSDIFSINVMISDKIPALFIETSSGSLKYIEKEKGNGEPGMYRMVDAEGVTTASGEITKLRSRGNATFLEDKKPYQINLYQEAELTNGGMRDKYVLLANRQDQSLIRNCIMYDMASYMGLEYSPESVFVDLFINNDYRGNYQLCRKIETGKYGIDINTRSESAITDYLVSLEYPFEDRVNEEEYIFSTKTGQYVNVEEPGKPTSEQFKYIQSHFEGLQEEILSGKPDKGKFDETSFVRKYLIEEISKNLDAMHASQYFYSDNGKVYAGPVWDMDKTLGNPLIEHNRPVNFQEPKGIYAATTQYGDSWWKDICAIDEFSEEVKKEYRENALKILDRIIEKEIDNYKELLWDSARLDYIRWDTLEDQKYERDLDFEKGYGAQIEIIRNFLMERREFLNDIWIDNRKYHIIQCDPKGGTMHVSFIDAVEGRKLREPRNPVLEGKEFSGWIRKDTGRPYDFDTVYDGTPFVLEAVYE